MKNLVKSSILGASIALGSLCAHAGPVEVDYFNDGFQQATYTGATGGSNWATQASGTMLGGYRDLYVQRTGGSAGVNSGTVTLNVDGGLLNFSSATNTAGMGFVRWDGAATGGAIDANGLGGMDLAAQASQFVAKIDFADAGFLFNVKAYSSATNYTIFSAAGISVNSGPGSLPQGTEFEFHFAQFGLANGTYNFGYGPVTITQFGSGVDFSNLGALEISFAGLSGLDFSIDSVAAVPEPAALALVGIGLLGLGVSRRRRAQ